MEVYKRLYVLIEGNDDERFVNRIVKPIIANNYDHVGTYKYAKKSKKIIVRFINNISSMGADFICLGDINDSPCITAKKQRIQEDKIGDVDDDRIIVIIREIESWYLAGLDDTRCKKLRIRTYNATDDINKEEFEVLISRNKSGSRISCMLEILGNFDITVAKQKNNSFAYFHRNYLQ